MQIGLWEMSFRNRRRCLLDKKFSFSGPSSSYSFIYDVTERMPPMIEVAQRFHGSVPSESASLCKISYWSVQDCQSYLRETDFGWVQCIQWRRNCDEYTTGMLYKSTCSRYQTNTMRNNMNHGSDVTYVWRDAISLACDRRELTITWTPY